MLHVVKGYNITTEDMGMSTVAGFLVGMGDHFWQLIVVMELLAIVWFLTSMNLNDRKEDLSIYQAIPIAVLWSALGIFLIIFNKVLFLPEGFGFGFPYAIFLMWWHCLVGTISTNILRFLSPQMIPAVAEQQLDVKTYFVNVFPVAGFQAASLGLGNTAYLFISVAYIQMVKNTTAAFVYIFSIMLALEKGTNATTMAVLMVVLGLVLTSVGELNFTLIGFVIQISATLCDSLRMALTKIILSSKHSVRLDPMSALYYAAPTMFVFLSVPMYIRDFRHMTWDILYNLRFVLMANALLAFTLNMTSMLFIKRCGPTAYALTGVVKDIALILLSCAAFGHPMTGMQLLGFLVSLIGFQLYNKLKEDQAYLEKWYSSVGWSSEEEKKPLIDDQASEPARKALSQV